MSAVAELPSVRTRALVEAAFTPDQLARALDAIAADRIARLPGGGACLVVSSDGRRTYRTTVAGVCTCPAGARRRLCYHVAAVRLLAAGGEV